MKQNTIARPVSFSGIGLHTGEQTKITLKPAEENTGVIFERIDLPERTRIPAIVDCVESVQRGTTIGKDRVRIHTVEHLLAALAGTGVDNVLVEIEGNEIPALDGSSLPFVKGIDEAGLVQQSAERREAVLTEPLSYEENGVHFLVLPNDKLKISFHIEYNNPLVGCQFESLDITGENFRNMIAEARTYSFLNEVEELKNRGLIKGGSLENAVVFDEDRILNPGPLRSPKEPVRHKILDLLGDIQLLGMPMRAHIISFKSGHPSNVNLVRKIRDHLDNNGGHVRVPLQDDLADYVGAPAVKPLMGINDIMDKIPHRYPFLMVDRILEFEAEKRVVGIKNVSINEPFFQGHFPGHPIMPGVLIVEAMGQAGGMLLMNSVPNPETKVMYFMSLDKIKFRKPVFPGDQLRLEVEMIKYRHSICKMKGCCYVEDELVAEAELTAMVVERDPLQDQRGL
ncbi:MAG: bifunctional UDP-3-O-[3-hydroxymyristoyl] N-acetylglucosamine deacetylase/3-hydroxyacyl-ACP dehydratase [Candidatus Glassbacteria bacterium]|nr:bifunctional UDP-3-O-[3-hydroxymyristoyl] N-acetylglucosamine deacetylase/3-hydroxyacyl-ACP dehydratase [Candidatus Glassbacteria bacterium]